MKARVVTGLIISAILVFANGATAESPSVLIEKGIYAEDTAGDLDAAIEIYSRIIADDNAKRQYVAKAQYRLGTCYLKQGKQAEAIEAFKRVIKIYPNQRQAFSDARSELAKLSDFAQGPPIVLSTTPAVASDMVSSELDKLTVTFDQPMLNNSWSWTGGGDTYPEITEKPYYDDTRMTCTLPVKLKPGTHYVIGINSPSYRNFKSQNKESAQPYLFVFGTRTDDGKPAVIPDYILAKAEQINSKVPKIKPKRPKVQSTVPEAFANNVSPDLKEITVTFDQAMVDGSWSWTGGGDTYPKTTSKPFYDKGRTTCTLPVKLEPGKVYWIGINSPSYQNFRGANGRSAQRYVILFATSDKNGNPTTIPADMLGSAKAIN